MALPTWTLTGTLKDHGSRPLAGVQVKIVPTPTVTVDAAGDTLHLGSVVARTDSTGVLVDPVSKAAGVKLVAAPDVTWTVVIPGFGERWIVGPTTAVTKKLSDFTSGRPPFLTPSEAASLESRIAALEAGNSPFFTEAVQDIVGAMLTGVSGVSVTYDDATGKVTITGSGGGSGPIQTTATAPTFDDNADTYTIPTRTGVDYYVGGVKQTAGTKAWSDTDADVVVTAQPQAGYTLTGTVSWTLNFTKKSVVSNLALIDNGDGTFTASGASVVDNGDNTFTINDPAASLAGDLFTLSV